MGMNDKEIGLHWAAGSWNDLPKNIGGVCIELVGFGKQEECCIFSRTSPLPFSVKKAHKVNR